MAVLCWACEEGEYQLMREDDIDISGHKFGRWVVIKRNGFMYGNYPAWLCRCECGTEKTVAAYSLIKGKSTSCGCKRKETSVERLYRHGDAKGDGSTCERLYRIWQNMKDRCYNEKNKYYNDYGARGITVCDEWIRDYTNFKSWAEENGYDKNLNWVECSIDRIDNSKGYSPDNCRWVSAKVQANNRRNNVYYSYNGEEHTLRQWSGILGFDYELVKGRIWSGWSFEKAISTRAKAAKMYTYKQETHSIPEWAEIVGVSDKAIYNRLEHGLTIDEALEKPFRKRM